MTSHNQKPNIPSFSLQKDVVNVFDATIKSIKSNHHALLVTITYRNCPTCNEPVQTVTLVTGPNTVFRNERGCTIKKQELQTGMIINASFSASTTRSIPPQAQAYLIMIVKRPTTFPNILRL